MVNVLGISGSLRKGSYNTALLRAAQELAPDDMTIEIFDLAPIPSYNEDVKEQGFPPPVAQMREAMRAADGLLFVTPEYNRSVSGVLKNAIDWASRGPEQPFDGKPVAIMGASRGPLGTIMANHHLRQILAYLNVHMLNGPEVLLGGAPGKFDAAGKLTDQATLDYVRQNLSRFDALIHKLSA